ncbi:TPA: hypothetical protein OMQ57_000076 [Acinetobacter baumannii]|nr:hypothetical protein [Acinetobacter baumannii]
MAKVIQSNSRYVGSYLKKNIFTTLQSDADKIEFVKNMIISNNLNILDKFIANQTNVVNALTAHINRVQNDGGMLQSLLRLIEAYIFIFSNNLTLSNVSAISPEFGVKVATGGLIQKLYDIGSNFADQVSADLANNNVYLSFDNEHAVESYGDTATKTYTKYVKASAGVAFSSLVIGVSAANKTNNDSGSYVQSPNLTSDLAGSTSWGALQINNGNSNKLLYKDGSGTTQTLAYSTAIGNGRYADYRGVVGYLKPSTFPKMFTNGENIANGTINVGTIPQIYHFSSLVQDTNFISESWLINSDSEQLAQLLSTYLTK